MIDKRSVLSCAAAALFALGALSPLHAGEGAAPEGSEEMARLRAKLEKAIPGRAPSSIRKSVVPGVYEVLYDLRQYYITADGRYLITDIVDLENGGGKLPKTHLDQAIAKAINAIGEDHMVIFGDKAKSKYTVNIFTDIDCGYCRKLHSEMDGYNGAGIRVRYLFYPRAGVGSDSYKKAVAVWCAKDRNAAMTRAKRGERIEMKECDNPVKSHLKLGERIGLHGTPAIALADGTVIPGYIPPKRLAAFLERKAAGSAGR